MKLEEVMIIKKESTEGIIINGVSKILEAYQVMIDSKLYLMVKTLHSNVERLRVLDNDKIIYQSCTECGELLTNDRFRNRTARKNSSAKCKKCLNRKQANKSMTVRHTNFLTSVFGDDCPYCNKCLDIETVHVEHFIPRSKGGKDKDSNLLRVCSSCNSSKSDTDFFEWSKDYFGYLHSMGFKYSPYDVQKRMVDYFKKYYGIDYSDRINVPAE